jgi:hypothetical protein
MLVSNVAIRAHRLLSLMAIVCLVYGLLLELRLIYKAVVLNEARVIFLLQLDLTNVCRSEVGVLT